MGDAACKREIADRINQERRQHSIKEIVNRVSIAAMSGQYEHTYVGRLSGEQLMALREQGYDVESNERGDTYVISW